MVPCSSAATTRLLLGSSTMRANACRNSARQSFCLPTVVPYLSRPPIATRFVTRRHFSRHQVLFHLLPTSILLIVSLFIDSVGSSLFSLLLYAGSVLPFPPNVYITRLVAYAGAAIVPWMSSRTLTAGSVRPIPDMSSHSHDSEIRYL